MGEAIGGDAGVGCEASVGSAGSRPQSAWVPVAAGAKIRMDRANSITRPPRWTRRDRTAAADEHPCRRPGGAAPRTCSGRLEFDALLALQRRLVYDVGRRPRHAAPSSCATTRRASPSAARGAASTSGPTPDELTARGWPVRWVSRGGGVMLHLPGQVACLPGPRRSTGSASPLPGTSASLQAVVVDLLREYGSAAASRTRTARGRRRTAGGSPTSASRSATG